MNEANLVEQYSTYFSTEPLRNKLKFVCKYLPEAVNYSIPSIQVGQDGLTLSNILLVTDNYLCDVRLEGTESTSEFDYVAKNSVMNYYFKTWVSEIKEEDVVKASFHIAEVVLRHYDVGLNTNLSFAGTEKEREDWLENLIKAIPVNTVIA